MKETRADTTRAFIYAIALHALLFALMFLGLWWTRTSAPLSAAGSPIEAELIDPNALSAKMKRALAQRPKPVEPQPVPQPEPEPEPVEEETVPPPQPLPEPVPEESPVERQVQAQERIPEPDTEQQEEVRRDAISAETREREQEEKRRQEQIDLTERERQREAEERQRLARQQEREDKLKKIRAERARLQRQAQLAEQKLKQIADHEAQSASEAAAEADASASPPPGNNGVDEGLLRQYMLAIQAAVTSKWTRPDNMPGLPCKMRIVQLPGGEVMSVEFDASCPYDEAGKRSVEAAVLKAQPLPYAGFEPVFNRRLNFTFRPN